MLNKFHNCCVTAEHASIKVVVQYFIAFTCENSQTSACNQKIYIQIPHITLQLVRYYLSLISMFGI
jgi:hypothetical protein